MSVRTRSSRLFGQDRKERKRIPGQTPKYQPDEESSEAQVSVGQVESPREFRLSEDQEAGLEAAEGRSESKAAPDSQRILEQRVQQPRLSENKVVVKSMTSPIATKKTIEPNQVADRAFEPFPEEVKLSDNRPNKIFADQKAISHVHKKVINYFLTGDSADPNLDKIREARKKELEKARAEKEWAKPKKKYVPPPPTAGTGNKSTFDENSVKSPTLKKNPKPTKTSGDTPSQKPGDPKPQNKAFDFRGPANKTADADPAAQTRSRLPKVEEERSVERSKSKTSVEREKQPLRMSAVVSDPYLNDLVLPPPPARIPQVNIEVSPGVFNLQLILDTMNDIRTNPKAYVSRINSLYLDYITDKSYHKYFNVKYKEGKRAFLEAKVFLSRVKPVPALRLDDGLTTAAYLHSKYLSETNLLEHRSKDGTKPFERMLKFGSIGKAFKGGSENILRTPLPTPEDWLLDMVIDDGVATRGHRENFFNEGGSVGIGVARNGKDIWLTLDYFMHGFTADPTATTKQVWKNSGLDNFHPKESKKEESKPKQKKTEKARSREKQARKPEPLPEDKNPRKEVAGEILDNELPRPTQLEAPQSPKAAPPEIKLAPQKPTDAPTEAKQPTEPAGPADPPAEPVPAPTTDSVAVPSPETQEVPVEPALAPAAETSPLEQPPAEEQERRRRSTEVLSATPSQ